LLGEVAERHDSDQTLLTVEHRKAAKLISAPSDASPLSVSWSSKAYVTVRRHYVGDLRRRRIAALGDRIDDDVTIREHADDALAVAHGQRDRCRGSSSSCAASRIGASGRITSTFDVITVSQLHDEPPTSLLDRAYARARRTIRLLLGPAESCSPLRIGQGAGQTLGVYVGRRTCDQPEADGGKREAAYAAALRAVEARATRPRDWKSDSPRASVSQ
jgi:hypothetical protein